MPSASATPSTLSSAATSESVIPSVPMTRISVRCSLSYVASADRSMAGLAERMPAKNATPSVEIRRIDKNRLKLFWISRRKSFLIPFVIADFLYHSIYSTGVGRLFCKIWSILPFFTLITLSAIGAIARLCVMTTMVTPFSRQVSCRSFKIDLPVT